jgi:hypothetical protein
VSSEQSWREQEIASLQRRIDQLRARPVPIYACAQCGKSPVNLTEIRVLTSEGEEGHSDVSRMLCDDDYETMINHLIGLGFVDHRHGSTSSLEDPRCPGFNDMDRCPTPTHYGNVTWGRTPPQDSERDT